jgi:hypothetical protein
VKFTLVQERPGRHGEPVRMERRLLCPGRGAFAMYHISETRMEK